MKITEKKKDDVTILSVDGKIDSNSSESFEKKLIELLEQKEKKLLLDFSLVDYISSAGLKAMLIAVKKAKNINAKLAISNPNENVANIINMAGFSAMMPYFSGLDDATSFLYEKYNEDAQKEDSQEEDKNK